MNSNIMKAVNIMFPKFEFSLYLKSKAYDVLGFMPRKLYLLSPTCFCYSACNLMLHRCGINVLLQRVKKYLLNVCFHVRAKTKTFAKIINAENNYTDVLFNLNLWHEQGIIKD